MWRSIVTLIESKQKIFVDFIARLLLQKRLLQDLKKNSSLNFERHCIAIEEHNDFIYPLMFA